MKILIFIYFLLTFSGCVTSFQNVLTAELSFENSNDSMIIDSTLFSIMHNIADNNGLYFDSSRSVLGKVAGFYGRPYHYFEFIISDSSSENTKFLQFTHTAMLSSSKHDYEESEYLLKDSLDILFQKRIKSLQLKHK